MSAANKVLNKNPSELELQVAQSLIDLENSAVELKADLRLLQFKSVRLIDVDGGKKALVIFVPVPSLASFQKVQQTLSHELEKKFSDSHVVILAERRILAKPSRKSKPGQKRPKSRTLTAVHDAILGDLVFPAEIVGKRVRYSVGGGRLHKVIIDNKDVNAVDYKLDSFQSVYSKLTGKSVAFEIQAAPGAVY